MKKREINIDEFTSKDIEDLKIENIDLRVQNNKLLNDNFLLASMNTNLKKEINEFKKAIEFLNVIFEIKVSETILPEEHHNCKYTISFKRDTNSEHGMFLYTNKVPEEIRKLMMQDGNND